MTKYNNKFISRKERVSLIADILFTGAMNCMQHNKSTTKNKQEPDKITTSSKPCILTNRSFSDSVVLQNKT